MAKTVRAITAAIESKPPTLTHLEELYDAVHRFDKKAGNEKAFLEKFGSKKKWLSQFKRQPYDKEA